MPRQERGIAAFPIGQDHCPVSELSDTEDQKAMTTYLNQCRSYLGVCKIDGGVHDLVAVAHPGMDEKIEWLVEHYHNGAPPKSDEVKIVEWQNGLYPFSIGDFFTNTVLTQIYNVPGEDAVQVAEALAAA